MSPSLFDDVGREDVRPASFDESAFSFLNRRAGARWQRVRDLLDAWFDQVPSEARADLRGRLRSGTAVDFRSAFFELYCHEALRRGGCDLEHHPVLEHTARRPDLRASRFDVITYVEVTTTSQPRIDEAAEARLNTVLDAINNRIEIDHFMLGIDVLNVGRDAPATGPLCDKLQAWLLSLNADQLLTAGNSGNDDGVESVEWTQDGWNLVLRHTLSRLTVGVQAVESLARSARRRLAPSTT